jgi:hypothetical protein
MPSSSALIAISIAFFIVISSIISPLVVFDYIFIVFKKNNLKINSRLHNSSFFLFINRTFCSKQAALPCNYQYQSECGFLLNAGLFCRSGRGYQHLVRKA